MPNDEYIINLSGLAQLYRHVIHLFPIAINEPFNHNDYFLLSLNAKTISREARFVEIGKIGNHLPYVAKKRRMSLTFTVSLNFHLCVPEFSHFVVM